MRLQYSGGYATAVLCLAYARLLNGDDPSSRFTARSEITPYHGVYVQIGVYFLCITAASYIESVPNRSIFGKDLYFRGALLHGSGFQLILVRFLSAKPA